MSYSLKLEGSNLIIDSLDNLPDLKKVLEANNIKPNYSYIGRELGVDRRTVKKYYDGYKKEITRDKPSRLDKYRKILDDLLDNKKTHFFHSKTELWKYMKDNYNIDTSQSNFRKYINNNPKYKKYFDE